MQRYYVQRFELPTKKNTTILIWLVLELLGFCRRRCTTTRPTSSYPPGTQAGTNQPSGKHQNPPRDDSFTTGQYFCSVQTFCLISIRNEHLALKPAQRRNDSFTTRSFFLIKTIYTQNECRAVKYTVLNWKKILLLNDDFLCLKLSY